MKITKSQACQILGVSEGASIDEIRSNYKHLARKWHPDKQHGSNASEEATQKFQEVSAAYKKLTTNETDFDEDRMTLTEMMELYRQLFSFGNSMAGVNHCSCPHHHPPYYRYNDDLSDYDDYDYTDDDDSDEEFWESIASRLRNKYEIRKSMPKDSKDIPHSGITEEEAMRNAQELIEEEEIEKKRKEKKKAKKKKKKEKRKLKDKEDKKLVNGNRNEDTEKLNLESQGKDEKKAVEHSWLQNGHAVHMKTDSKNRSNTRNNKRYEEKAHKPMKIVQEDIRPSIPNDNKEEKDVKVGKDARSAKNTVGSDEEEQFDASSAFFARAASKAPNTQPALAQHAPTQQTGSEKLSEVKPTKKDKSKQVGPQKIKEIKKTGTKLKETNEDVQIRDRNGEEEKNMKETLAEENSKEKQNINTNSDSIIIKSRKLAVKGNELAGKEQYMDAIIMFSEAIKLDPSDYRFFGNRSYCYDRTGQYENALKDSQSAISLAHQWPKGYFRKGRALIGLERYQEAEEAFHTVLTLDKECPDAQFELEKVRVRILTDMGFQKPFAEESVKIHGTVQSALEALLAGNVTPRSDDGNDDNWTSEETPQRPSGAPSEKREPVIVTTTTTATPQQKIKQKCTALWVGNVNSHVVTEKQLSQLFSKYGKLVSVRLLPEKFCAFINFYASEDAAKALEKLQGHELSGQNLLIRYPNNPPPGSVVIQNTDRGTNIKKPVEKTVAASKITGPVNGNECYFWRTTGCVFESHCRYMHVEDHKGVDLAKVRAKYGTHL